ncbi:MAG: NAD(P)-dependent oxidoreductase [Saprospiraceae bacterium]
MKIGIIKEGKVPPDNRVALTPKQCKVVLKDYPVGIIVQPSPDRCISLDEYRAAGIPVSNDLSDCDVLLGVKEVPISQLIPGKTYFFFSHTIKKQPYNRDLLRAILEMNIRLIDYEVLTDDWGSRLIAFGRFAGMVGAHNALLAYGKRLGEFHLPRMKEFEHYAEAKVFYQGVNFPKCRIVLTGSGRVSKGAKMVLQDMGIQEVSPEGFLTEEFNMPVFTQLDSLHYVQRKDGRPFRKDDFYNNPAEYKSSFAPYFQRTDIMINGIFWNVKVPAFFTLEEMQSLEFRIQVIADVTCDIAPVASIPSTIRPSTISDPVYGFDPATRQEKPPFSPPFVDVMAVDNLPNELPRDASDSFGQQFLQYIIPELMKSQSDMLERATIAQNGELTPNYRYLEDYVGAIHSGE